MKRLSFLLLDANVVIYLFEHQLWERLVDTCDIHLARTVVDEAHFYEDDQGVRHDFDVNEWKKDITIVDVPLGDVEAFCNRFDASYTEKLDPGEAESLAWLVSSNSKEKSTASRGMSWCSRPTTARQYSRKASANRCSTESSERLSNRSHRFWSPRFMRMELPPLNRTRNRKWPRAKAVRACHPSAGESFRRPSDGPLSESGLLPDHSKTSNSTVS